MQPKHATLVAALFLTGCGFGMSKDGPDALRRAHALAEFHLPGGEKGFSSFEGGGAQFTFVGDAGYPTKTWLVLSRLPIPPGAGTFDPQSAARAVMNKPLDPPFQPSSTRFTRLRLCGVETMAAVQAGELVEGQAPAVRHLAYFENREKLMFVTLTALQPVPRRGRHSSSPGCAEGDSDVQLRSNYPWYILY